MHKPSIAGERNREAKLFPEAITFYAAETSDLPAKVVVSDTRGWTHVAARRAKRVTDVQGVAATIGFWKRHLAARQRAISSIEQRVTVMAARQR